MVGILLEIIFRAKIPVDYKLTCRRIHQTNYEPTKLVPDAEKSP